MEESLKILKKHNIRVTQQRIEVYKLILKTDKYLTAEEIYKTIREKVPAISLATIYSILDVLKEKGLIKQIRIKFNKSCFGTAKNFQHYFLCKACGRIFDVGMLPCSVLMNKKVDGHSIEELQGYFYGICKCCLEKGK
jgi:Fur family peroxide stress response transcriptional regulator|tara:strand:- start:717 stop:1130 length:414 start_codon:yes stop_codon:yes gene_type:complete